jgi:predicted PurR-regulated permease PerM
MSSPPDWRPPRWLDVATGWSWRLLVVVAAIAVTMAAVVSLSAVVVPLVLGLILTSVLSPITVHLRRRGVRPGLAASAGLGALLVFIGLFVWLLLAALIGPWDTIADQVGRGIDVLVREFNQRFDGDITQVSDDIRNGAGQVAMTLLGGVVGLVGVAIGLVTTLFLTLLVVFFYLKDGPTMWTWFVGHQRRHHDVVDRVGRAMWEKVNAFVRGTAAVAAVDAIGIALGALVLGVPSVFAIGVLTFSLGFIPYFGAFFAGAIAVAIALADGGLSQGLLMVVVVVIVQQLESNFLQPVLVGRAVRLHPLVVALGVIAGGSLAGVLGMFLAVPVIAAATAAVNEVRAVSGPGESGPGNEGLRPSATRSEGPAEPGEPVQPAV